MSTLLEITDDMKALDQLLAEREGDVSDPDVLAAVEKWFAEIGEARDQKIDAYATYIRELELRIACRKEEAERLQKKVRSDENRIEFLKGRLKEFFQTTGTKKVEGRFTVTLQANGGKIPLIVEVDPKDLQEQYRTSKTTYAANQDAIRADLEAGKDLGFARLGERGSSIRIR